MVNAAVRLTLTLAHTVEIPYIHSHSIQCYMSEIIIFARSGKMHIILMH